MCANNCTMTTKKYPFFYFSTFPPWNTNKLSKTQILMMKFWSFAIILETMPECLRKLFPLRSLNHASNWMRPPTLVKIKEKNKWLLSLKSLSCSFKSQPNRIWMPWAFSEVWEAFTLLARMSIWREKIWTRTIFCRV